MGVVDTDDSSTLQQMMYEILCNFPTAVDDKIYLHALRYKNPNTDVEDKVTATLQASYTKKVTGRYEYYNGEPSSYLSFDNCDPDEASWMRIAVPYSSTPYRAVAIKMNELIEGENYDGPMVIDIGTENNFYGGYVDVTNGTVIFTYDSAGALTYVETPDTEPQSGKTYYTESGGVYTEFVGDEFEVGVTYYEVEETENADIIDDTEITFLSGSNTIEVYSIIGPVTYVVTSDQEPIEGKNYYTKSDETYTLFEGDEFVSGTTYYEEQDTTGTATVDRLIYPVPDGTILDRMNLVIEHSNLYVGI